MSRDRKSERNASFYKNKQTKNGEREKTRTHQSVNVTLKLICTCLIIILFWYASLVHTFIIRRHIVAV